jgi:enamine deaminase RidA (YjgF/YER057c/UK114 family)
MGYAEQAATALQNFIHALEATGAALEDLAQMTIYVVGLNAETGDEMFKGIAATSKAAGMKPSASVITGVSSLMDPAALIEISGIAVTSS